MKKLVLLIIALVLALGAWKLLGAGRGQSFAFSEPVSRIDVKLGAGSVTFLTHEGEDVIVTSKASPLLKPGLPLNVSLKNGTLSVRSSSFLFSLLGLADRDVTVSLPETLVPDALTVSVSSADVRLDSLSAESISLSASSGTIAAAVKEADSMKIDSTSGSVTLAADQLGTLTVKTTSGRSDISLAQADAVTLRATSGSISLAGASCGTLDAAVASGTIDISLDEARAARFESASGSVTAAFAALPTEAQFSAASGNVRLILPDNAEFIADIDTASGRVKSDFPLTTDGKTALCGDGAARLNISTASGNVTLSKAGQ